MNQLFQQYGFNQNNFLGRLNALKAKGGDPNQMIQQMMNSGRVSQAQYNEAVNRANQIMQMFNPRG